MHSRLPNAGRHFAPSTPHAAETVTEVGLLWIGMLPGSTEPMVAVTRASSPIGHRGEGERGLSGCRNFGICWHDKNLDVQRACPRFKGAGGSTPALFCAVERSFGEAGRLGNLPHGAGLGHPDGLQRGNDGHTEIVTCLRKIVNDISAATSGNLFAVSSVSTYVCISLPSFVRRACPCLLRLPLPLRSGAV